jgi:hypothetical protein
VSQGDQKILSLDSQEDRSAAERPAAAPTAICPNHVRSIVTRTGGSCQDPPGTPTLRQPTSAEHLRRATTGRAGSNWRKLGTPHSN